MPVRPFEPARAINRGLFNVDISISIPNRLAVFQAQIHLFADDLFPRHELAMTWPCNLWSEVFQHLQRQKKRRLSG